MSTTYCALLNGVGTGDDLPAADWNKTVGVIDRNALLQYEQFEGGRWSGWTLNAGTSTISSGMGQVGPFVVRNTASQAVSNMVSGTCYVHAVTVAGSPASGTVAFKGRATSALLTNFDNTTEGICVGQCTYTTSSGISSAVTRGDAPVRIDARRVGVRQLSPTLPIDVSGAVGFTALGGLAIKLTNGTGGTTVAGQVVMAQSGVADAFTAAGASTTLPMGVTYEGGVASAAKAWVVVGGIADVLLKDSTVATAGNWVHMSDTAGRANATKTATSGTLAAIGKCLETCASGVGVTARCVLQFGR